MIRKLAAKIRNFLLIALKYIKKRLSMTKNKKYYSETYGWMEVVTTITDGTITVIECRAWNDQIVCVSLPKERNFFEKPQHDQNV